MKFGTEVMGVCGSGIDWYHYIVLGEEINVSEIMWMPVLMIGSDTPTFVRSADIVEVGKNFTRHSKRFNIEEKEND